MPTEPALPQTLENLHLYTLDKDGKVVERRRLTNGPYLKMMRKVEAEFMEVFKRPMELDDINPDVAMMILTRHKRESRTSVVRTRYEWFVQRAKVAELLGWRPKQDYSHLTPARQVEWKSRQPIPTPPQPEQKATTKPKMTLLDLLNDHYRPVRLVGKSARTVSLYKYTIAAFSKWLGRAALIEDLSNKTVGEFLQWMLDNTELSPATVEKDRTQLSVLWNFAAKRRWVDEHCEIRPIHCPERVPDAWTAENMVALMNACESAPGMIGQVPASDFWPALVSLIDDTGERIGAVMAVTWDDIDDQGFVTFQGNTRKGKTRDKRFRMRPETIERINKLRSKGAKKVFAWPWCDTHIWAKFGKILEAAGLPNNRRTKFHKQRRTVASNFEAAGGNATALLDHSHRRTTKAYLDPRVIKEQQPADIVPGIGVKAPEPPADEPSEQDRILIEFREYMRRKDGKGGAA